MRKNAHVARQNDQTDKLAVSIQRAAEMLDVSRRTIENFIAVQRIPARKVGTRTLILVRDLEAFLRTDQPSPSRERRAVA
jgi:excisionase family DNA binding protein